MLNKSLLSFLGIAALAWIIYSVLTIGTNGIAPSPSVVFGTADTSVLVVHKPKELQYNNPEYGFIQTEPFYVQVLAQPERVQHFYFSSSRKLLVLERSKPWTIQRLKAYFGKMGYGVTQQGGKDIRISNGWKGRFQDNYVALSMLELDENETAIVDWNFVDRKASASLIKHPKADKNYIIENAYMLSNSKVKYVSQHTIGALPLVDDQEFFQSFIPLDYDSYTFYQTDYLKTLDGQSPLFGCMNSGMVVIEQKGEKCIVLDYKLGKDPISVLENSIELEPGSENKGELDCSIPLQLFNGKCQIELFNGYALISDDKSMINSLLGNYETGNTLEQSERRKLELFRNTPRKVSYRYFNNETHITKSCLTKTMHTVIDQLTDEESEGEEEIVKIAPIRLDGRITSILALENTSLVYATTDANSIHLTNSDQLRWTKTFDSPIVGVPMLVPGTQSICIPTETELHFINSGGAEMPGFPIQFNHIQSSASTFSANGQTMIAIVADGQIHAFNTAGKKIANLSIGTNANAVLNISVDRRGWLAHAIADNTWFTFNLKKKTKLRSFALGSGDWYLAHYNQNILPVGVQNNKFVRYGENGKSTLLIGNISKMVRYKAAQSQELFFLTQNQHIYVVDGLGNMITQFNSPLRNIQDAYLIRSTKGETFVGILDGISNNSYIYTINGNEAYKQVFEGSEKLVFQNDANGRLSLITGSNGYLFRYQLH
jgi:hypothetical protein